MNDTACFLHAREIFCALKTFSPLQRIRTRPTNLLADKKKRVAVKELPSSPPPAARGESYLCLPVLWEISHGMHQNQHRNTELLHFWLQPPTAVPLEIGGYTFLDFVWIHRVITSGILFVQACFRGIHKTQYVRSFLKNLCWITVDPHTHTRAIDCKSPTLSREGQETHNQFQEKQILHFKLPGYWLHLYGNSDYVSLRVTFTSLVWLLQHRIGAMVFKATSLTAA